MDAKSGGSHLGAKAAGPTPDQTTPAQVSEEAVSISRQLDEVNGVERMLVALVRAHGRLVSPHISPYLPISPYISLVALVRAHGRPGLHTRTRSPTRSLTLGLTLSLTLSLILSLTLSLTLSLAL